MEWVFAHMEDADFNDPLPDPSATPTTQPTTKTSEANPESVAMLTSMGFAAAAATAALSVRGNLERAADWLFSHADNLQAAIDEVNGDASTSNTPGGTDVAQTVIDGDGEYELFGIVSHMGGNTIAGTTSRTWRSTGNGTFSTIERLPCRKNHRPI